MYYRQKLRNEFGIPMEAKVLLSVGELNANKNHQVVIKALTQLEKENVYYVICGQGQLEEELKILIQKFGFGKKVILTGYRTDVDKFYQMADIFVFPSLREGLGLAAIEAMASGLPLITSDIHGINDYSVDGMTGYKCDRYDVLQYAKVIKKFCSEKNSEILFADMRTNNTLKAKKYDVENINILMKEIYEKAEDILKRE